MSWRNAHLWLRGYSDARAGKSPEQDGASYLHGYGVGFGR